MRRSLIVLTIAQSLPDAPTQTSLVFQVYGERRFLSEVRLAGDGFALLKSKTEHKQAQLAKANSPRN